MKTHSYTSFVILLVAILCVTSSVWGFLFYRISLNKADSEAALGEIAAQNEKDRSLSSVRMLVAGVKGSVAELDDSFVYSDDIASFVKDLEKEGTSAHVDLSISSLNFDATNAAVVKPLGAHVDITGAWADVITLIGRIERLPKALSIDHVGLTRLGDPQSKKTSWKSSFDIQTYVVDRKPQ